MKNSHSGTRTTALSRAPRQARSLRTLNQILEAAWFLLEEGGVEAVHVAQITRQAKVSVGSFYARFEGKEELLEHMGELALEEALTAWAERSGDSIKALLTLQLELYRKGPSRRLILLEGAGAQTSPRLARLEEEEVAHLSGPLTSDKGPPELQALALAAAARSLALSTVSLDAARTILLGFAAEHSAPGRPMTRGGGAKSSPSPDPFDVWG